eukprot:Selendium_serpulae@DN6149_c0_g1_i8.p1
MAYYSIVHLLQGNMYGTAQGDCRIGAEDLTDQLLHYVFLQTDSLPTDADARIQNAAKRCRSEFAYWYPMDLRVSAKDLIFNHLTMCLYNHAAIWENQAHFWPISFFCNGYVLVDKKKMAKSEGNFITVDQAVKDYTADASRITLADAGDGLDDANFPRQTN